ncbi:MAG TPA: Rieske (2Fe-2S) protein, partial [Longimicrobiales bacterium]
MSQDCACGSCLLAGVTVEAAQVADSAGAAAALPPPPEGSRPALAGADAEGLDRRGFISRSTLAAVVAVLSGACGTGADILALRQRSGGSGGLPAGGLTLKLGDYPALAQVGGIARADTTAGPIALVRTGASAFSAFSMVCPHQGSTINIQGSGFVCPNHGARFNAAGQWTGGQPTTSLVSFPVTFDATTGVLTLGVTNAPTPSQPQGPTPTGNINLVVDLAAFPALAQVGGVARVDNGTGAPVGAARIAATQFVAYSLACT